MSINKVYLDNEMLIDLSTDTVSSAGDIAKGKIGHLNTGEVVTGTLEGGGGGDSEIVAKLIGENTAGSIDLDLSNDTFTSLRSYALYYNSAIRSIILPTTITKILNNAFQNCTKLASINIAELSNLKSLGGYLMSNTLITDITLPASVNSVSAYTFYSMANLKTLDMSACTTMTLIPQYLANNCSSLETVTLPDSVTSLGTNGFQNDSKLTTLHLPNSLGTISNYLCHTCTALSTLVLPSNITSIGNYAFQYSGLTAITIPQRVTSVGGQTFGGCSKLTEVHFLGKPTTIATSAFNGCTNLLDIYVPWSYGQVSGAPWGATKAQIYYDYVEDD